MKSIAFLDIESTGVDPQEDRIIDLAIVRSSSDGNVEHSWRVNPGVPIPAGATKIHGIRPQDVVRAPLFSTIANDVLLALYGCDLAGYNLRAFDLPLLAAEFARAGITWTPGNAAIIDVFGIFRRKVPRTLSGAVSYYTGLPHDGAHGAMGDVKATMDVLEAQKVIHYDLGGLSREALAAYSSEIDLDGEPAQPLDMSGKLAITADGVVRYTFGKHRGKAVRNLTSYGEWFAGASFPADAKAIVATLISAGKAAQ